MRYVFLVAGVLPWMRAALPRRDWRKTVAAVQGVTLTVAAAGVLPAAWARAALARRARPARRVVRPRRALALASAGVRRDGAERGAPRGSALAVGRTAGVLAPLLLWAVLVAPDRLSRSDATTFLRIPVEALAVVAVAVVLPPRLRAALAVLVGLALTGVTVVRALDTGFARTLDRPFDPLSDWKLLGPAVGVVSDSSGLPRAALLVGGHWRRGRRRPRRAHARRRCASPGSPPGTGPGRCGRSPRSAPCGRCAPPRPSPPAPARRSRPRAPPSCSPRRSSLRASACATSGRSPARWPATDRFAAHPAPTGPAAPAPAGRPPQRCAAPVVPRTGSPAGAARRPARRGRPAGVRGELRPGGRRGLRAVAAGHGPCSTRRRPPARRRASPRAARSSPRRRSAAAAGSRTPRSSPACGSTASPATTSCWAADRLTLTAAFERAGWRTVPYIPSSPSPWPEGQGLYRLRRHVRHHDVGYTGPAFSYAQIPDQYTLHGTARRASWGHAAPPAGDGRARPGVEPRAVGAAAATWSRGSQLGDGSVFDPMPRQGQRRPRRSCAVPSACARPTASRSATP